MPLRYSKEIVRSGAAAAHQPQSWTVATTGTPLKKHHLHHHHHHPHLRQPLASRRSAKTRVGSNHGEPTPLTLASRCGSVGPLLRPRECTTTPDPSGEYDEARGSRPQDVGVSSSRPHSQRPTKGARRRQMASRLSTSPPKLTKQLRRADKARGGGLPRQT